MAGLISRFVSGAAGGAAESIADWGKVEARKAAEVDLMGMRAKIESERDARLHDYTKDLVGVKETVRREGEMYDVKNIDPLKNENALKLAKDKTQAEIDIKNSPENVQKTIDTAKKLGPVEAQIKLDAEMAVLAGKSTPQALRALQAIARATQAPQQLTPGQVAEGEIKRLEVSRAKLKDQMQNDYAEAVRTKDTARANGIVQAMTARFFDPAKLNDNAELRAAQVVVTSMDPAITPEQKLQAGDFIMKALASAASERGAGNNPPPVPGARMGNDGKWYVTRDGKNYPVIPAPGGSSSSPSRSSAAPAAPTGLIANTPIPLLTAEDQQRINAAPSQAARNQLRNEIMRQRQIESAAARRVAEEPLAAEEERRYRERGIDPNRPRF